MTIHKAGFVAIIGEPNAGKSTLLNAMLGFRLSIVSSKPQTTRHRILGLLNGKDHQVCFVDTPGSLGATADRLQESLVRSTRQAAGPEADLVVLLAEPETPSPESLERLARLAGTGRPVLLAVNKIDRGASAERLRKAEEAFAKALPLAGICRVSALKGTGVPELVERIVSNLPASPAYYDKGQVSDRWERFFAAELIREQIFSLYRAEIPHACAVVIETFKETPGRKDRVSAMIFVERSTQKAIVIGKRGAAVRELTTNSLRSLEKFLGRRVELDLRVGVRKNWRKDKAALKEFGYIP